MRRLAHTVVAGGVVYPAGTSEAEVPEGQIRNARHWTDDGQPEPAASQLFDPADHDVEGVNEHLEDADDDERARVLAAEADGKKRKGVLEGPHGSDAQG